MADAGNGGAAGGNGGDGGHPILGSSAVLAGLAGFLSLLVFKNISVGDVEYPLDEHPIVRLVLMICCIIFAALGVFNVIRSFDRVAVTFIYVGMGLVFWVLMNAIFIYSVWSFFSKETPFIETESLPRGAFTGLLVVAVVAFVLGALSLLFTWRYLPAPPWLWGRKEIPLVAMSLVIFALFVAALFIFKPPATSAASMYRGGPQRTGAVSGSFDPLACDRAAHPIDLGGVIRTSPAVGQNAVYVGSDDGHLYAVQIANRKRVWDFVAGGGIHSSPAFSEGIVYFGADDGAVYAVDAKKREVHWRFPTGQYRNPPPYPLPSVESSPLISDGVVYIGSNDGNLYAIDAKSGSELWHFPTQGAVRSSPSIYRGTVYVGSDDGNLYAIDALSGKERWHFTTNPRAPIFSTPAVSYDKVYFGSDNGKVYAIGSGGGRVPLGVPRERGSRAVVGCCGGRRHLYRKHGRLAVRIEPVGRNAYLEIVHWRLVWPIRPHRGG